MWDLVFGIGCIVIAIAALISPNERLFTMLSFGRRSKYNPDSKPTKSYLKFIRFLFFLMMLLGLYIVIMIFFP